MYNLLNSKYVDYQYSDWLAYLKQNDTCRLQSDFSEEPILNLSARKLIFPSITAFQRGEHSDGIHLSIEAQKFAAQYQEPDYPEVMQYFIREENFHSSYLARYMHFHHEPLSQEIPLDRIFRKIRKSMGIFSEISVLITAEIIALTYYTALGNVGRELKSPALSAICEQMLHDELRHIILQSYTLGHLCTGREVTVFRHLLMEKTTAAVWLAYGNLIREGGFSYGAFRDENLGYLEQSLSIAQKRSI